MLIEDKINWWIEKYIIKEDEGTFAQMKRDLLLIIEDTYNRGFVNGFEREKRSEKQFPRGEGG